MSTFKKAIDFFEVKVEVQKGALRSREIIDSKCVSFIPFLFSSIFVLCQVYHEKLKKLDVESKKSIKGQSTIRRAKIMSHITFFPQYLTLL